MAASLLSRSSAEQAGDQASVSQDITIHGKHAHGPALGAPPMVPEKLIFEDVLQSLDIQKKDSSDPNSLQHARKLSRRFPEAPYLLFSPESFHYKYDRWTFEILRGDQVIKHLQGKGQLHSKVGWDGTDPQGQFIAKVDEPYRVRFIGATKGGEEHTVATNLIMLGSMVYRHSYDFVYLDLANNLIFSENGGGLSDTGPDYLHDLAARMRQHNPKKSPYRLVLYQKDPNSAIAKSRANALKVFLANELLVHPKRLAVEIEPITDRGDVTTCILPSRDYAYTQEEQD